MKVLAVPLARQRSTAKTFFTYLVHANKASIQQATPSRVSWMTKMSNMTSSFWVGLGRNDRTSLLDWRRRTFRMGEKVMDQIAYEEWALKGIDHGLGPRLKHVVEGHSEKTRDMSPLTIQYPSSLVTQEETTTSFRELSKAREPHHYRWLVYNLIGIPATAPLFIVPALPNILTYYVVWRAWSHWRAYVASHYLNVLQSRKLVQAEPYDELDMLLQRGVEAEKEGATTSVPAPDASRDVALNASTDAAPHAPADVLPTGPPSASDTQQDEWQIYLQPHHIDALVSHFDLEAQSRVDLRRAQEQMAALIQRTT